MKKLMQSVSGVARSLSKSTRIALLTSLMLVSVLLGSVAPRITHAQSSQIEDWQIRLEKVRVSNADEDDVWSDGDEPYFIVIGFRSTFNESNSTDVFWGRRLYEVHSGADDGDEAYIQNRMGFLSFPDVEVLSLSDLASGKFPELLGAIVIAMESDATPFDGVSGLMNNVEKTLEQELTKLIENGEINLLNPSADIAEAINRVESSAIPRGLDALWLGLSSWGDPDDVVGVHVFLFAALKENIPVPSLPGNITAGRIRPYSYRIESNSGLVFNGNGSKYEVSATIDKVQKYGVNIRLAHNGKCIDVHAPQWETSGGRIQQWDCFGSNQLNQLWTLVPVDGGFYQITGGSVYNQHLCLTNKDGSMSNGGIVDLWECRGVGKNNQLWRLRDMGNGYSQIISKQSGLCLDVAWDSVPDNGGQIYQWECRDTGNSNQLWRITSP